MTRPVRLQLSRRKGFRLQQASRAVNGLPAVVVARPGKWGNPHVALRCWHHGGVARRPAFKTKDAAEADLEGRAIAVALYRETVAQYLAGAGGDALRAAMADELAGRNLACWCRPGTPCHADALLELANREPSPC